MRDKMKFLEQKSNRDDMLIKGLEERDSQTSSADKKRQTILRLPKIIDIDQANKNSMLGDTLANSVNTKTQANSGEEASNLRRKLELAMDEIHAQKESTKRLMREKEHDFKSFQELNASLRDSLKRDINLSPQNESFPPAV
jgi:hypothetical protein